MQRHLLKKWLWQTPFHNRITSNSAKRSLLFQLHLYWLRPFFDLIMSARYLVCFPPKRVSMALQSHLLRHQPPYLIQLLLSLLQLVLQGMDSSFQLVLLVDLLLLPPFLLQSRTLACQLWRPWLIDWLIRLCAADLISISWFRSVSSSWRCCLEPGPRRLDCRHLPVLSFIFCVDCMFIISDQIMILKANTALKHKHNHSSPSSTTRRENLIVETAKQNDLNWKACSTLCHLFDHRANLFALCCVAFLHVILFPSNKIISSPRIQLSYLPQRSRPVALTAFLLRNSSKWLRLLCRNRHKKNTTKAQINVMEHKTSKHEKCIRRHCVLITISTPCLIAKVTALRNLSTQTRKEPNLWTQTKRQLHRWTDSLGSFWRCVSCAKQDKHERFHRFLGWGCAHSSITETSNPGVM